MNIADKLISMGYTINETWPIRQCGKTMLNTLEVVRPYIESIITMTAGPVPIDASAEEHAYMELDMLGVWLDEYAATGKGIRFKGYDLYIDYYHLDEEDRLHLIGEYYDRTDAYLTAVRENVGLISYITADKDTVRYKDIIESDGYFVGDLGNITVGQLSDGRNIVRTEYTCDPHILPIANLYFYDPPTEAQVRSAVALVAAQSYLQRAKSHKYKWEGETIHWLDMPGDLASKLCSWISHTYF